MKGSAAVWLFLLLATILWQWMGGAYAAGWDGHADEPAHVITGLMVRDYLAAGCPWPPMPFAEQYYVHYPKVALGHWPPFFYLVSAFWMLLLPPARPSLLLLMAAIGASTAALVYELLKGETRRSTALAFALVLTTLPVIRQSHSMVMSDGLVALLCLAATWFYARYLESSDLRGALMFGVLAGLAVLTKGTGVVLFAVPPLAVTAQRRWDLFRQWRFWVPAIAVIAIAAPWYGYQLASFPDGPVALAGIGKAPSLTNNHFSGLGLSEWLLLPLAAIGLAVCWYRAATPRWASLGALAVSGSLAPYGMHAMKEPRHMLPVVPPVLCLAAAGLEALARRRWPVWNPPVAAKRLGLLSVVVLASFAAMFQIPRSRPAAFRDAANRVLAQTRTDDRILVSSDVLPEEGDLMQSWRFARSGPGV